MRRCLLLFTVACVWLSAAAAAHAAVFGANVQGNFADQQQGLSTPEQTVAALATLRAAGGTVARTGSDWAASEPHPPRRHHPRFDWRYDDMVAGELARADLRWQPTLGFAPRWAQTHASRRVIVAGRRVSVQLPPAHPDSLATYAAAFTRRYGPHGAFWGAHPNLPDLPVTMVEVWNEPDNVHYWGRPVNLSAYVRLYETVRARVHRVDAHARVLTGGLAWTISSLPRLLHALAGQPVDAVAFHPYAPTAAATIKIARRAVKIMRRYERTRTALVANEFGWTATPDTWGSTPSGLINRYDRRALLGLAALPVSEITPFLWSNPTWGWSEGVFAHTVAQAQARSRRAHSG